MSLIYIDNIVVNIVKSRCKDKTQRKRKFLTEPVGSPAAPFGVSKDSPETGDPSAVFALMALAAGSAGVGGVSWKFRRKR